MKEEKVIPKVILDVGFDFQWSEEKVWALDIPVEEMDIRELEWHFGLPFWNKGNGYYDLKPNEVLANPEMHKEEFDRTMKADLSHPLDIMFWKNRWLLLDGLHRLAKAKLLRLEKIKVRKIDAKYIPIIKR